ICGAPGSIKGIQVRGAVTVRWEDEAGNEVGNTPDLLSVPAGTYMLYASTNNDPHDDCGRSLRFTIPDTKPQVDASYASIIMPCGNSSGSITGMAVYNGYNNTFKWLNERNEVVGTGQALTNVPAGTYRLFAYSSPTCFDVSDPILLTDQQGPVIDVANMTVTPSTCMNDNGAIRNIQMGGTGDLSLRWLDENDVQVGSSANIGNLAPGTYRLEVTDESTCPALLSAPVVIGSAGAITLDVSQMQIQPAGCNNQPGNITGIQVTGADSYTWRNRSGETAGNTINLNGVPAGDYMLEAKNSYNCSAQTAWITLTNKPAASWNVKGEIRLPVCNESNGEVRITDISGAQVTNIRWTDAATNATLGTGRTLPGIGPGDYKLYLTDPDGCEQEVYTASIPVRTAPVLAGPPQITDETCGRSNGAILMPGVNGSGPFLVGWTDNTGALVEIEPELKDVKAGSYFVEAMDMYGCTVRSDAYIVENVAAPLDPPADQSLAIGKGLPLNINITAPYPATFTLYADEAAAFPLQQNTTGVFAMPPLQQDANYFVTLSADICKSPPAKIAVKAVDKIMVGIPTAFTPNSDGLNDIFRPQYAMMASLESFSVYSRWGNEVFTTKTMGIGWNGRMNGTDLPAGSYIYIIRGKDLLGNAFQAQGSVLLIR
ncbi:MAG: gliding motility-associated C-terminal domain-containing protein, partial [Chitinophaga sp.]